MGVGGAVFLRNRHCLLSILHKSDLEFNLLNYSSKYVDSARTLARSYLPGKTPGAHAAHALDSIAGGYPHCFVGYRNPIQSRIGALWKSRRAKIVPGKKHQLIPEFE